MEYGSLSAAIYWVNMLANNIEPPPIVKGCIFEYGCEHHIKKLMNSMVEEIKAKSSQLEKDVLLQRSQTNNRFPLNDNNIKFNLLELESSNINFLEENYRKVSQRNDIRSEQKIEIMKEDGFGGPVDIDMVWSTEKPVMFGLGPVDELERRTSLTKVDISFSEDEFTLGAEIKQMLITLVD